MKALTRFFVVIFVLVIIVVTIYYVVTTDGQRKVIPLSPLENIEESKINDSYTESKEPIDEYKDEVIRINEFVDTFKELEKIEMYDTYIDSVILGERAEEFSKFILVDEMFVNIQKMENKGALYITIIPMLDFLDNQMFFFDSNGDLKLYVSISNTVGGNIEYYFSNGKLIHTINNMDSYVMPEFEKSNNILRRANKLYNLYNKI
ncbi:MAG: hypothetical protein IKK43_06350 [Clostridia bacterium]|nr:hypothetical protein [Clostridia bacterium]